MVSLLLLHAVAGSMYGCLQDCSEVNTTVLSFEHGDEAIKGENGVLSCATTAAVVGFFWVFIHNFP